MLKTKVFENSNFSYFLGIKSEINHKVISHIIFIPTFTVKVLPSNIYGPHIYGPL